MKLLDMFGGIPDENKMAEKCHVDKVLRPNYPATKSALSHEQDKILGADHDPDSSDDDDNDIGKSSLSSSCLFWAIP